MDTTSTDGASAGDFPGEGVAALAGGDLAAFVSGQQAEIEQQASERTPKTNNPTKDAEHALNVKQAQDFVGAILGPVARMAERRAEEFGITKEEHETIKLLGGKILHKRTRITGAENGAETVLAVFLAAKLLDSTELYYRHHGELPLAKYMGGRSSIKDEREETREDPNAAFMQDAGEDT